MKGKPGFATINAKEEFAYKIGIISAVEKLKIYEVIELAIKETFPDYFEQEDGVLEMVKQV